MGLGWSLSLVVWHDQLLAPDYPGHRLDSHHAPRGTGRGRLQARPAIHESVRETSVSMDVRQGLVVRQTPRFDLCPLHVQAGTVLRLPPGV